MSPPSGRAAPPLIRLAARSVSGQREPHDCRESRRQAPLQPIHARPRLRRAPALRCRATYTASA
eukprot:7687444-Heterocapsa_arctica.AAC.1